MSKMPDLSEAALALLKLRLAGHSADVTEENREAYRELARAGMMLPLHSFVRGDEALYRFTEEGWAMCHEIINATPSPSPAGSSAPGR